MHVAYDGTKSLFNIEVGEICGFLFWNQDHSFSSRFLCSYFFPLVIMPGSMLIAQDIKLIGFNPSSQET
jgi:hypothetical protein